MKSNGQIAYEFYHNKKYRPAYITPWQRLPEYEQQIWEDLANEILMNCSTG